MLGTNASCFNKVYPFDLFIFKRTSVVEKEDWRSVIDLVTNAKQVVYSVQDVARRLADYTKFRRKEDSSAEPALHYTQGCKYFCYYDQL